MSAADLLVGMLGGDAPSSPPNTSETADPSGGKGYHQSYENPAPVVDAKVNGGVVKVRSVRLMVEAYEPCGTARQESKSPAF